ncbi:carbohydrate ABC transporter permease [Paenibacillus eucommiae]|uniref:Aldouronate transport system permease protein n=1 Tax=Paenibacillus eucommiae TaxID=1355755 RepID=A0ABS4IXD6_9BACL|nr:carbohydrate ABC transporter permease [Paenibacillus eucommiae]MBP1992223.1 putative aldouronate transport system permease protein [Paenibacillus eucommiae]
MLHRTWLDRLSDGIIILILCLVAAAMIVPFVYIFSVSFTSMEEYLRRTFILWPERWVTSAYQYILSNDRFVKSIGVTVYITALGTLLNLAFTTTMAYGLSRQFYGRKLILFMVLFTFLFSAGIIPTYLIVKATGLINTVWALILPVLISPWNLIVFSQFFKGIPEELNEAALMDGANPFTVFKSIILPLSKPALATFGLFYAVSHWNSYFTGILYISNPKLWPIQVLLRQIVVVNDTSALTMTEQILSDPPPAETIQMAAILLATVPILILYPFLQKHFAKGVMIGSVKG